MHLSELLSAFVPGIANAITKNHIYKTLRFKIKHVYPVINAIYIVELTLG